MRKKAFLSFILLLLSSHVLLSQETFKVMFYNVLNYPLQLPASRIDNLETIIEDYRPDIFMICELNNEQGSDAILSMLQSVNSNYAGADFVLNTSDDLSGDQNDLQNMLYYDNTKFILEDQNEIPTVYRDFNHYTLKVNTVDQATNPLIINAFACHLKSSSGSSNEQSRLDMVNELVAYLDTMPTDSYVLLGGDLNFYTDSEDGFQKLINPTNSITFVDPVNRIGSWHENTTYIDVFTQSTRTQSGLGGATGGFDDRFDFIMTSENLISDPQLFYVNDSYQVYGNNETINCYNQAINSTDCAGSEFGQAIRDALYLMSDHLPVTLSLETTESLSNPAFNLVNAIKIRGTNVVNDLLLLDIHPPLLQGQRIKIVNTLGQNLGSYNIDQLNLLKINVSNLSKGLYYIVVSDRNIQPLKFIKN